MDIFNKGKLERLNNEIERLNGEIENLRKELSDNKIDNKVLQIRIKDLEKMLQDKQEEMNEYINELDHMVIERSNLIEKTNTQSDIIDTLKNEVKSVKEKFRELVRLSEEYKNDMENQLEEMERKLEEKKIIDIRKEEEAIEKLKKEALEEIDKQLEEMDKMKEKRQEEIKQSCEVIRNEMLRKARNERDEIGREVLELREELKDLELVRGEFLLQEIGMLENPYEYETSQEFQEKLNIIKKEQKEMVRNGKALVFSTTWTVANSKTKGDKFMKGISKLALKSFNNECDNIIINVKYSSMSIAKDKIEKSFKDTNKFIQVMECAITDEYLELKIKELQLKCGWLEKREQEKEELKRQAEILREQEKLEKEIKLEEEKIEIEQQHFNNEITNLKNQIANGGNEDRLREEIAKLQAKIDELEGRKATVLERKMHNKAGYVYIISNPSLEGMFKVGVTKRLQPQVRIDELSSASVPFKFAVHSFIFSQDAFALEHTLHMAFDDKRVNKINKHKEFFYATLEQIKEEVFKHNPNAEFIDEAVVEDYILSMEM